jgi:hypothetical protein
MLLFVGQGRMVDIQNNQKSSRRNGVRVGRVGVIIPVLVMCGLLVPACSQGSSAVSKRTNPVRATTETVRTGRFTQIFDTNLPANPAQASAVEEFRAGMILWDKSQATAKLVSPVTAYVTGTALRNLKTSRQGESSGCGYRRDRSFLQNSCNRDLGQQCDDYHMR